MAATTLHRLMLAGEAAIYLLLGLVLALRCDWSYGQVLGLIALMMLAGRAFIIGVTFAGGAASNQQPGIRNQKPIQRRAIR